MSATPEPKNIFQEASNYFQIGMLTEAACTFKQYLSKALNKEDEFYVSALQFIGVCHKKQGKYSEAISYYQKALVISKRNNYVLGIADSLSNIGVAYKNLGIQFRENNEDDKANQTFISAVETYKEVIKLDRAINNLSGIATDLNNLGIVYTHLMEKSKALGAFEEAISIAQKENLVHTEGLSLGGVAKIYLFSDDIDKSIDYYEQSISKLVQTSDFYYLAINMVNLGSIYYEKEDYVKAKTLLTSALTYYDSMGIHHPKEEEIKLLLQKMDRA